ncbi:hypothetical protein ACFQX6_62690 [Streptosporangium lutulentum]
MTGSWKAGSPGSTSVRVTTTTARPSSALRMSVPIVAWVWAPHQSSGTGGTTSAEIWFFRTRLPTWGPLPWVRVTW